MLLPFLQNTIKKASLIVADHLQKELELQGHIASGNLKKSIQPGTIKTGDNFIDQVIEMLAYGEDVDQGVSAQNVAPVKVHFGDILRWIKTKGLSSGNQAEDVKFALNTARKHKREGIPTKSSLRFSKTGKRTGFISDGSEKALPEITEKIALDIEQAIYQILL